MKPPITSGGSEKMGFILPSSTSCKMGHFEYPPTYREGNAKTTRLILYSLIIKEHIGQGSQLVYNVQEDKSAVSRNLCALFMAAISACSETLVLELFVPSAINLSSIVIK